MCRSLIQATAPRVFTQVARNPARNVVIGDPHMVLVPTYGSPFIHNLDEGRRYATIEDFRNFVKLAYMSQTLHHSGGTLCEPVDLPVNKRHLEMVYSHIRYSDKAFMGSVTHPSRAQDSIDMARIVFGAERMEREHVIMGLANANSPMAWDYNMLGSAKVYAENNQIVLVTPFILGGAMAPVTIAAPATQTLAEALAGMAFCQLVRPGAPVIFGSFASSMSMQSGAPTFGTPEPQLVLFVMAALARRLGVPFRSGGNFTASKVPDYQAAYESAVSYMATMMAGVNFNLHTAGWLEGGLAIGYEKFILDDDQASMTSAYIGGVDLSENGLGAPGDARRRAGSALPRLAAHPRELRGRLLAVAAVRQQQLRAVGARRWARRCGSRQRPVEAAARSVRSAAARRRDRRGAPGLARGTPGRRTRLGRLGQDGPRPEIRSGRRRRPPPRPRELRAASSGPHRSGAPRPGGGAAPRAGCGSSSGGPARPR